MNKMTSVKPWNRNRISSILNAAELSIKSFPDLTKYLMGLSKCA